MNLGDNTIFLLTAVHNGIEYTKEYLSCVKKQDYKNIVSVLVDDGSNDGTEDFINTNYPKTIVIKGNGNLWWTGSMEIGISYICKHAKESDYIVTINNDCVFDKAYIGNLLKSALQNKDSIMGSLVLDQKTKQIVDAGVKINWKKALFVPIKKISKVNNLIKVDTLSTKGTIFPVSIFKKIGNFNAKQYPHYLSDYEFACRAKKHGYKLFLNNKAVVFNDNRRTGMIVGEDKKITPYELLKYMKSKKSKINISDQINFFKTYCPKKYKIPCYFAIAKKMLYLVSLIPPLYYLRKTFIWEK